MTKQMNCEMFTEEHHVFVICLSR